MAKQNYTDEMVARMRVVYEAAETDAARRAAVESLAEEFGRKTNSVIAKLSHLGIYQRPERKTKSGGEVVTKEKLADRIAQMVGINPETSGLAKANKGALRSLADWCQNHSDPEPE